MSPCKPGVACAPRSGSLLVASFSSLPSLRKEASLLPNSERSGLSPTPTHTVHPVQLRVHLPHPRPCCCRALAPLGWLGVPVKEVVLTMLLALRFMGTVR